MSDPAQVAIFLEDGKFPDDISRFSGLKNATLNELCNIIQDQKLGKELLAENACDVLAVKQHGNYRVLLSNLDDSENTENF